MASALPARGRGLFMSSTTLTCVFVLALGSGVGKLWMGRRGFAGWCKRVVFVVVRVLDVEEIDTALRRRKY